MAELVTKLLKIYKGDIENQKSIQEWGETFLPIEK